MTLNGLNLTVAAGAATPTNTGLFVIERGTAVLASNPTFYAGNIQIGSNNGGVGTLKLGANNVFGTGTVATGASVIDVYNGSSLDLNGFSNTVNNLTFAADGGSNGNQGASIQTGVGTLTLNGDLTATILNQATTIPGMQGNLSLPAGTHTFNIGTVVGAPGQVGFQLNSSLAGTGGITKTGNGILGLAGSTSGGYVGTISVNTGSIQFTQNAATASFTLANPINLSGAAINLGGTGTLNAGGFIGTVGTLTGTGTVTSTVGTLNVTSQILNNFTVVPQVNVGGDNGIGSFGGLLTGGVILGKVGTGNQTLTNGGSTYTAGTVVNGGILTLGGGAGVNVTGTGLLSVNNTGTLAGVGGATGGIQFNSGSAANFALGAPAGPAPLTPATVNSGGAATFNITGTTGVGTYSLIDYAGTAITAGQMAGMKLGTTPGGGFLYGLVNNAANTSIAVEATLGFLPGGGGVENVERRDQRHLEYRDEQLHYLQRGRAGRLRQWSRESHDHRSNPHPAGDHFQQLRRQ